MNDIQPTVLIADSDPASAADLTLMLKEKGYRVFPVSSAREALQCTRKHRIDIAVLDTQLRDIKGHKIIPLMKDLDDRIQFVVTTGELSDLEKEARVQGIAYFGVKPLDLQEITESIEIAMNVKLKKDARIII